MLTGEKREYAQGTFLATRQPWGIFVGGRALCPDGVVRNLKRISICADSFFSVPAAITYRGKTIAGFVSMDTIGGNSIPTDNDLAVVRFHCYEYRRNGSMFSQDKPQD